MNKKYYVKSIYTPPTKTIGINLTLIGDDVEHFERHLRESQERLPKTTQDDLVNWMVRNFLQHYPIVEDSDGTLRIVETDHHGCDSEDYDDFDPEELFGGRDEDC